MRQFKNDAPEFFVFQLEGSEEVFNIPLASSMTNKQLRAFEETNGEFQRQVDWLRGFVGDMVDDLTPATTKQIMLAWMSASDEDGASVGESSASDA